MVSCAATVNRVIRQLFVNTVSPSVRRYS